LANQLKESDLVTRFPLDTTELIIYLTNCIQGYQTGEIAEVAKRLTNIPPKLPINWQVHQWIFSVITELED
jgi:hypothetical protein